MKREALKSLALKAKNRMIHKKDCDMSGVAVDSANVNIKVINSGSDDLFFNKVRSLLENNEDIVNPIKKLMDETVLMRLDARGRERYLLDTVEKYHRCRKMLEEEKYMSESV